MRLVVLSSVLAAIGAIAAVQATELVERSPRWQAALVSLEELGPLSGWRCLRDAVYVYDPRHERPDQALLAEAPEATLRAQAPGVEAIRVEANLRTGETVIWTTWTTADQPDGDVHQRVYVLVPGRLHAVVVVSGDGQRTICNSQLGAWQVVGEHELG